MRFYTEQDVRRLLPMPAAIGCMRRVFEELREARAINQPRRRLILPTGSVLHALAGAFGAYFGTKVYATHTKHGAHFLFLLYAAEDARPLALFEANELGQIRTGAATGYATDLLARRDAAVVGLIGTGYQARGQLEAVLAVRKIREVRVWSRSAEKRSEFAAWARGLGVEVRDTDSAEATVRGADIVITATYARDPVLSSEWIAPGTHINAVGSNQPRRRELPGDLIERADLVAVDTIEAARIEAGDLLMALDETGWQHVRELQNVEPRSDDKAVTVFKSVGLGVEDVAVAGYIYEQEPEGIAELPVFHS